MINAARHVIGEVNAECPPSWHSATWGNWGVSSNWGGLTNADQFRGWKVSGSQGQWNSCTRDHIRDTDNIYYNHDHNGNGLGDDQWIDTAWIYTGAQIDQYTGCPMDTNYDGVCDTGGCLALNSTGFGVGGQFLSLYELDWPDGDDFITTLYAHSGCCHVNLSCSKDYCSGPVFSPWWPTTYSTNTAVTANVIMKVWDAQFIDSNGYCEQLGYSDPRYNCN